MHNQRAANSIKESPRLIQTTQIRNRNTLQARASDTACDKAAHIHTLQHTDPPSHISIYIPIYTDAYRGEVGVHNSVAAASHEQ